MYTCIVQTRCERI